MLTQLPTLKARLVIASTDPQYDDLLTNVLKAVSLRFDRECNRTLARTVNFAQEFDPDSTEIRAACYPIETVSKFETKTSEAGGWQEVMPAPDCLVRHGCIISLRRPLICAPPGLARVTYTAGYVLPGDPDIPGATRLPDDLEQAAVEQVAFWFQNRDMLGVIRTWPKGGSYKQLDGVDLLPGTRAILSSYTRLML